MAQWIPPCNHSLKNKVSVTARVLFLCQQENKEVMLDFEIYTPLHLNRQLLLIPLPIYFLIVCIAIHSGPPCVMNA